MQALDEEKIVELVNIEFPIDKIYFSDDIAILPGDGQVVSIGDPRAVWSAEVNTHTEGFRPLYLHKDELDTPEAKTKIEIFLIRQRKEKDKFIDSRVWNAKYIIKNASNWQRMFQFLTGVYPDNSIQYEEDVEDFLKRFYLDKHNQMTSENILASAKEVVKQTPRVLGKSKKKTYEAVENLSKNAYSKTLVAYVANRPDFVILSHPDYSTIPSLLAQSRSGAASFHWDLITVAGTSNYDLAPFIPSPTFDTTSHKFPIHKNNNMHAPINYGGHAFYTYNLNDQNELNLKLDSKQPCSNHALRKQESLLIEEISDFINTLLDRKSFSGAPIHSSIDTPSGINWLSAEEQTQLRETLKTLFISVTKWKKIVQKLKESATLDVEEQLFWDKFKNQLVEAEKNLIMQPRHIVVPINLSDFPDIKIGNKLKTSKDSAFNGVEVSVVNILKTTGNKAVLDLEAPPLEKDHQLHHYFLEDLLLQIENALEPGEDYKNREDWLPKESIGRLRGIIDNYPVAKELLFGIIPYLEIIDQNIQAAIAQDFLKYTQSINNGEIKSVSEITISDKDGLHAHPIYFLERDNEIINSSQIINESFNFQLASDTFKNTENDSLLHSTVETDNTVLPHWLQCNTTSCVFSSTTIQTGITSMSSGSQNADSLSASTQFNETSFNFLQTFDGVDKSLVVGAAAATVITGITYLTRKLGFFSAKHTEENTPLINHETSKNSLNS